VMRALLVSIGALGGVRAGPVSAGSAGATSTPLGFPARIIHRKQQRTDTDTEVLVGRPSKRSKRASHEQARMPSSQNVGLGMALPQAWATDEPGGRRGCGGLEHQGAPVAVELPNSRRSHTAVQRSLADVWAGPEHVDRLGMLNE
jgi:hypothetical protein